MALADLDAIVEYIEVGRKMRVHDMRKTVKLFTIKLFFSQKYNPERKCELKKFLYIILHGIIQKHYRITPP